jgi:hypothetical protein
MYAFQGQYSEAHTRSVSIDLAQIAQDQPKYDHQVKYRFLHVTDTGDLVPIYSASQS